MIPRGSTCGTDRALTIEMSCQRAFPCDYSSDIAGDSASTLLGKINTNSQEIYMLFGRMFARGLPL